jgi:hypothetical protein
MLRGHYIAVSGKNAKLKSGFRLIAHYSRRIFVFSNFGARMGQGTVSSSWAHW